MSIVSDRDHEKARQLPDRFVKFPVGEASERIMELVSQHWKSYKAYARMDLAEALVLILEPLLEPGAVVSDRERELCDDAITKWVAAQ